jgi:hypothetical protein
MAVSLGVSCEKVAGQYAREHGSWGIYGNESRYQTRTGEDTADWEDLVRAAVNCWVCELAIALFAVVSIFNCSINPITNPNPVYSHDTRDSIL